MAIESFLCDVEFCDDVTIVLCLDDCLMAHIAYGGTVVGILSTTTKGDMVVLYVACTFDGLVEVGVIALVDDGKPVFPGCLTELIRIEHLYPFEDRLKADIAVVGDMELLLLATLRGHLDDTSSTT